MVKFLVVVDMQNDFIDGSLGTEEAVKILPNVINKIKGFDGRVVYTRDTHEPNYLSTQEGSKLPVEHCIRGTKGWQINEDIKNIMSEADGSTFDKITFGSKELAEYLLDVSKKEEIEEIQLVGLCTDICVISNALIIKAFLPETKIYVDSNCCAGVTPQSHNNALEAMKVCQIQIIE